MPAPPSNLELGREKARFVKAPRSVNRNVGQASGPGGEAERRPAIPLAPARSRAGGTPALRWAAPVHGPNACANMTWRLSLSMNRGCSVNFPGKSNGSAPFSVGAFYRNRF